MPGGEKGAGSWPSEQPEDDTFQEGSVLTECGGDKKLIMALTMGLRTGGFLIPWRQAHNGDG